MVEEKLDKKQYERKHKVLKGIMHFLTNMDLTDISFKKHL